MNQFEIVGGSISENSDFKKTQQKFRAKQKMLKKQAMLLLDDSKIIDTDLTDIKHTHNKGEKSANKINVHKYVSGAEVLTSHGFIFQFLPSAGRVLVEYIKNFLDEVKQKNKREHLSNLTRNKLLDRTEVTKQQTTEGEDKINRKQRKL